MFSRTRSTKATNNSRKQFNQHRLRLENLNDRITPSVTLQSPTATFSQDHAGIGTWPVAQLIDGKYSGGDNGWAILRFEGNSTSPEVAVFETASNLNVPAGGLLTFTFHQNYVNPHNLGRFRLSATTDPRSEFADGLASGGDVTANWSILTPLTATSTGGSSLSIQGDGAILASGANPTNAVYTVTAPTSLVDITGFRIEVLADSSLPTGGPGRHFNGNFVLSEFEVDIDPAPQVVSAVVNDGSAQRSRVTSMTVTFSELVDLPTTPANAFQLERNVPGGPNESVTFAVDTSLSTATQTIAKLTFSGALTEATSLIDGDYSLTVIGGQVTDKSGQPMAANHTTTFHCLFGDADGDRNVDASDFALFRLAFGSNPSWAFDFDNDGDVDIGDFGQFRARFGMSI